MTARTWRTVLLLSALTSTLVAIPVTIPATSHAAGDTIVVTTTIQAAVDAADPGDTVFVPAGTYAETVLVTKPGITIRGSARGGPRRQRAGPELRHPRPVARRVPARRLHPRGPDHPWVQLLRQPGQRRGQLPAHGHPLPRQPAVRAVPRALHPGRVDHNYVEGSLDSGVYVGQCSDVLVDHNVAHRNTIGLEVAALDPDRGRGQRLHRQRDRRAGADLAAASRQGHQGRGRTPQRAVGQQPAQHHHRRVPGRAARRRRHRQRGRRRRARSSTTSSPTTAAPGSAW